MNKFLSDILDQIYPPKCVVCGNYPVYKNVLCEKCYKLWLDEKRTVGIKSNFAAYYLPQQHNVTSKLLLTAKSKYLYHLYNFLAEEMAELISISMTVNISDMLIVNVPRTVKNKRQRGVDQTEIIAKYTAKLLEIKYMDAIVHSRGKEQKLLTYTKRFENARNSYDIRKNIISEIKNKSIILLDDIVTSGATIQTCSDLLMRNGSNDVYTFSLAKTFSPKIKGDF